MQMAYDTLIKGGLIVGPRCISRRDIGIRGETIAAVDLDLPEKNAAAVIDAGGRLVLPGLIDVHVHPVYTDSLMDCSILGVRGGVTTMIHYAYARPGEELAATVQQFIDEGRETSHTDFAVHGAMFDPKHQVKDISKCCGMGVRSFKMFMTYAKLGWMTDDYYLTMAMDVLSRLKGLAMVHAEDGLSIDYLEDKYRDRSQREVFLNMRPGTLEADAVFRAISIAGVVNCPLYIVHISAAEALDPIDRARAKGQAVFTETCPQYLTLTDQTLRQKGPLAKIGPPLRTEKDNAALWQALRNGLIDVVASDHAPKRKKVEDDFFKAPFGSPAAETLFVVPYQKGVNEGRIDICTLVRSMTATPAKIFGLYPRKGAITQGADADLVLFDPTRSWTITATPRPDTRCMRVLNALAPRPWSCSADAW